MRRKMRFGMVLAENEKNALVKLAQAEGGLSEAAMLRRLIHKAARDQGLFRPTEDTPEAEREVNHTERMPITSRCKTG